MKAFSGGSNLYWIAFGTDADSEHDCRAPKYMKFKPAPDWLMNFVRIFDPRAATVVGMSKNSRIQPKQARAQAVKDLDLLGCRGNGSKQDRASRNGIKNSTKIHMMLAGKEYELPSNCCRYVKELSDSAPASKSTSCERSGPAWRLCRGNGSKQEQSIPQGHQE